MTGFMDGELQLTDLRNAAAQTAVVITASGKGQRMGTSHPKQFLKIGGHPILAWTLWAFHRVELFGRIILVVPSGKEKLVQTSISERYNFTLIQKIITGGAERQDSVWQGLQELPADCKWVAIHDGVRPLVRRELIIELLKKVRKNGAAIPLVSSRDTIKIRHEDGRLETTDRNSIWQSQTPQIFEKETILKAFQTAIQKNFLGTDEASLVEHCGQKIDLVDGDYFNIKITHPPDLRAVAALLPLYFPEGLPAAKSGIGK